LPIKFFVPSILKGFLPLCTKINEKIISDSILLCIKAKIIKKLLQASLSWGEFLDFSDLVSNQGVETMKYPKYPKNNPSTLQHIFSISLTY
jgi:hypothetical protein